MATSEPGSTRSNQTTVTVFFARTNFLARSLLSRLLLSSSSTVRLADPTRTEPNPSLSDPIPPSSRTLSFSFSPSDPSPQTLAPSLAGSSAVFLFDPSLGSPSPADSFHLYNLTVLTTKRVAAACRLAGVPRLVFTGLAYADSGFDDWMFGGLLDDFRAQAERIVLRSNGMDGLSTCVLRVGIPFGPGDGVFVPFLVRCAKLGLAKFVIGNGENMCDITYVENVAHANICAEQSLESDKTSVAGQPIFITNHEPVKLWEFISNILDGLGYQRPGIHLPVKFVVHGALLFKWDGVRETVEAFSQLAAKDPIYSTQRDFTRPSKSDTFLGNGRVADILLWRDEKKTFFCVMVLFFLRYWFILSGRTFISSFAKLLLVVTAILFGHGHLPSSIFGHPLKKLPSSHFEVSEPVMTDLFLTVASAWNKGVCVLKLLAQGDDWNVLFKAVSCIYLLKLMLALPVSVLSAGGLICLFTLFILYEQFEPEVDQVITVSAVRGKKLAGKVVDKLPSSLVIFFHRS
ncbi:3-beta-hydroxysteroid-4-alpha-carboxylate 3-dehydrogenase (decarboxylating) protein [Dioscorea alata]|uniref:3-beta-hydroxysteroid-4-alpha-carboxylate 3-dehydrogenase (Decarboxylating) protein n=1 Tax=Dioscorea alata TaxID=55571 RepID=A0ACB7UT41_DIOAL|nr:3-beta-hydroxysteroid-4-alpha-carboxylate 3-dehydrogenase (decarboxylating) protein [Dioscorea alata]